MSFDFRANFLPNYKAMFFCRLLVHSAEATTPRLRVQRRSDKVRILFGADDSYALAGRFICIAERDLPWPRDYVPRDQACRGDDSFCVP